MKEGDIPISEAYRLRAREWVQADKAASLLEESKSIAFSQMVNRTISSAVGKMPHNRAEAIVKASNEYKEYIEKMVMLRSEANLLKVEVEYIRMKFSENQSAEANARSERRL